MTDFNVLWNDPKIAASNIGQYVVVQDDSTTDNQVTVAGSMNIDGIGVSQASVPTYGMPIGVARLGTTKVLVAASLGAGCRVTVASNNGGIGPITASGVVGSALTGSAQPPLYSIGKSTKAAAPGDYTTIFLDPREIL